jgi:hypothetical protein
MNEGQKKVLLPVALVLSIPSVLSGIYLISADVGEGVMGFFLLLGLPAILIGGAIFLKRG